MREEAAARRAEKPAREAPAAWEAPAAQVYLLLGEELIDILNLETPNVTYSIVPEHFVAVPMLGF